MVPGQECHADSRLPQRSQTPGPSASRLDRRFGPLLEVVSKAWHVALDAVGGSIEDVICTRVLVGTSSPTDLVEAWDAVRAASGDHDALS